MKKTVLPYLKGLKKPDQPESLSVKCYNRPSVSNPKLFSQRREFEGRAANAASCE